MKKNSMISPEVLSAFFLGWLLLLPGCAQNSLLEKDTVRGRLTELNASESHALIEKNSVVVILDVRTPEEFSRERIEGSVNIDFYSPEFARELGRLDKDKTYLVCCALGKRAMKAGNIMKQMEFRNIFILDGGLTAWEKAGLPLSR